MDSWTPTGHLDELDKRSADAGRSGHSTLESSSIVFRSQRVDDEFDVKTISYIERTPLFQ
jgi:hypothetical protein